MYNEVIGYIVKENEYVNLEIIYREIYRYINRYVRIFVFIVKMFWVK